MREQGIMTLKQKSRIRLDIREKFMSVRVVRPWNRLPRTAGDSLEMVKAGLDGALSKLV